MTSSAGPIHFSIFPEPWDSEWLKSFHSEIQDGCYSGHLENFETISAPERYVGLSLLGGIGETWRFRTAKFVPFRDLRLKFFSWHLLPNCNADWAQTWLVASEWHRDSELLKMFWSDIWDGILKIVKSHLLPNGKSDWAKTWWEALGWLGDSELLKTLLRYPRWLPQQHFWRSSIVSSPGAYAVVCWPWCIPHLYVRQ